MTLQRFGSAGPTPYRGYLAVDFFFMLSGLVVAQAYEGRLRAGMSFISFAKLRLIRLYPMIALGTALGFVSKLVTLHFSHLASLLQAVPLTLLLIPYSGDFDPGNNMFPLDPPLWSLMFECWVNFLFAALAIRFAAQLRRAVICGAVLGAVAMVPYTLADHGLSCVRLAGCGGAIRVICAFSIGISLKWWLTRAHCAGLPSIPFPALGLALLLALAAGARAGALYDMFAVLVLFPAIILLAAKDMASPRCRRIALAAGALSYPVYALHEPMIAPFMHLQQRPAAMTMALFIAAFLGVSAVGAAALRWADMPARRWLGQLAGPGTAIVPKDGSAAD